MAAERHIEQRRHFPALAATSTHRYAWSFNLFSARTSQQKTTEGELNTKPVALSNYRSCVRAEHGHRVLGQFEPSRSEHAVRTDDNEEPSHDPSLTRHAQEKMRKKMEDM
jgi:hypothetical protein